MLHIAVLVVFFVCLLLGVFFAGVGGVWVGVYVSNKSKY